MQGEMSTQAPMLPHAVLCLLGIGLQGLYAELLEQPLPVRMTDTLGRVREVPHLLPGLGVWTHARAIVASVKSHQSVAAL